MFKRILETITIIIFSMNNVNAQAPSIEWQYCFGTALGNESCRSIQATSDGGAIACGPGRLMKLDAAGTLMWQKTLIANEVYALQQTADGGYVIGAKAPTGPQDDYTIMKLNSIGDLEWQKSYGGSGFDAIEDIRQTSDGGYIVGGETNSTDGDVVGQHGLTDAWILRLDAAGDLIWKKTIGGSKSEAAQGILQTADGGFIFSGGTNSFDGDVINPGQGYISWTVKLDSNGNIQWQKTYGSPVWGTGAMAICLAQDGGYVFAGPCAINGGDVTGNHGEEDFWIVKLDVNGDLVWQRSLGGSNLDQPFYISSTADGGFIAAGRSWSADGDVSVNHGGMDVWVVKLDAAGTLMWQKAMGGNSSEMAYGVCQTTDMGYIIGGDTNSNNNGDVGPNHGGSDFWIIKLASDVLPITLSNFTATAKGADVLCEWKTMQEQNSSHFIVERSNDALHFTEIGRLTAAANSYLPKQYDLTDKNVLVTKSEYFFYRLKMVDMDGSFKYSNTVKVKLKFDSPLSIYPNPVVNELTVNYASLSNEQAGLVIYNDAGKKIYEQSIKVLKGNNNLHVNTSSLPAGSYTLVMNGQEKYIERFIKSK